MTTIIINGMVPGKRRLIVDWAGFVPDWDQSVRYMMDKHGNSESYAHPRYFLKQIEWCDVMYFQGGDTLRLMETINRAGDWKPAVKGKTICAYSAGVSALATYSYNQDHYVIVKGTGILPFNTIVHYNPGKRWMTTVLRNMYPDLPVLTISDNAYMEVVV